MPVVSWFEMYEAMKAIALEETKRADRFRKALEKIAAPGSTGVTDIARNALEEN